MTELSINRVLRRKEWILLLTGIAIGDWEKSQKLGLTNIATLGRLGHPKTPEPIHSKHFTFDF
ncbi:hypothetical protein [Argonema antarcticum]|uniref:hypothetical protein n=1 Tax=Argonema antarcticum TaxID=2942763 RepID=UPI0020135DE4|nr:hypothetical protein [Argonema antarcticum]MCL1475887.1 hypothetical protein [Argonema antarcticum A004/B2]